VIQKLSEGFQKPLTEKWKHLKKIVLPGGVHPVRNSSGALPPPGIIIKPDSAAAAGPASGLESLWFGESSEALFLTG